MSILRSLLSKHQAIAVWIGLAAGMVLVLALYLAFGATDVHLKAGQMATIVIATVAVAGICVWIISWE
ncbi:MAG: hypothetical protein HY677_02115 [Chloroflexi bacterium]|nr:hypothetical protein [Chloroflexota bacterium]